MQFTAEIVTVVRALVRENIQLYKTNNQANLVATYEYAKASDEQHS